MSIEDVFCAIEVIDDDGGGKSLGFDVEELFDKWGVELDPLEHIRDYIADSLECTEDGWVLDPNTKADMEFFLEQLCKNLDAAGMHSGVFRVVRSLADSDDLAFAEYFSALVHMMLVDDG
jgi:hypothetical protein